MISVLPCKDREEIEKLFKNHNISTDEFSGCVIARTGEEIIGYCLYCLTEKDITIFHIEPKEDILLADGILRSALHVAAENFVLDAFYSDTAPIDLFRTLAFIKNEDEKRLNIDKLFGGCNCQNKN